MVEFVRFIAIYDKPAAWHVDYMLEFWDEISYYSGHPSSGAWNEGGASQSIK
jgi:hypothetical protein